MTDADLDVLVAWHRNAADGLREVAGAYQGGGPVSRALASKQFVRSSKHEETIAAITGLRAEVERLRGAATTLQHIADGDAPRPRIKAWRDDGAPSKCDKCPHDMFMYDDCAGCIEDFARAALEAAPHPV